MEKKAHIKVLIAEDNPVVYKMTEKAVKSQSFLVDHDHYENFD